MNETGGAGRSERDWAADIRRYAPVWLVPKAAILIAAFASVPARAGVWVAALVWMGVACILNSRRCGRVHCRYTGPYYLALALAVLLYGIGVLPLGDYGWVYLGALSLLGGFVITWATEALWGRYE